MRSLLGLGLIAGLASSVSAGGRHYPGIIGDDDRQPLDSADHPWNAIGKIVVDGFSLKLFCTGTLVAPDTVVTAAHCLFNRRTGQYAKPNRISFIAGIRRDTHGEYSRAKCVKLLDPSIDFRTANIKAAPVDAAIITLAKSLSVPPIPIADGPSADADTIVTHVGYAWDRPYLLSAHRGCKITEVRNGAVATDCDTTFGQSGGPLLVRTKADWEVAGILVGLLKGVSSVGVPASVWRKYVADLSCGG